MITLPAVTLIAAILGACPVLSSAQSSQHGFETMTLPEEAEVECKAPRPPRGLAETAYIRNGYRAILRILAAEKWKETGSCRCFLTEITWEEVIEAGVGYKSSSDPKRPFDTSKLRLRADEMLSERDKACAD